MLLEKAWARVVGRMVGRTGRPRAVSSPLQHSVGANRVGDSVIPSSAKPLFTGSNPVVASNF